MEPNVRRQNRDRLVCLVDFAVTQDSSQLNVAYEIASMF